MKPLRLVFSAFGPYAGRENLDFADLKGRSFFLIHGPTGAGKTTILDVICFALYGDSSGNLRDGRTMRSDHAGLEMLTEVEFTFAVGTSIYKVWRSPEQERAKKRGEGVTISLADAALYEIKENEEKMLGHGYSNVTVKVEELLGFKSSQFRQVVLLPQGEFRKLLMANSAERQEIMQMLFRTEIYRQIEENLKQRAKKVEQERSQLVDKNAFILQEAGAVSAEELGTQIVKAEVVLKESAVQVKQLEAARLNAQKAVADGRVVESKFQLRQKAQLEANECEKLLPKVEEYRLIYQQAERAAQLADIEEQVDLLRKDGEADAKNVQKLAAAAMQLAMQEQEAECVFVGEQKREDQRELINLQVVQLAEFAGKNTQLEEARQAVKYKEIVVKETASEQEKGAQVWTALQETLSKKREVVQALMLAAAKVESCQAEWTKWTQLYEKLHDAAKLQKAQQVAQQSLAKARQEQSLVGAVYEAQQKKVAQLQHLFTEGQAAILAKNLVEAMPCPVCGSMDHPQPALSKVFLPDEREVKTAQVALAKLDQKRQQEERIVGRLQTEYDTLCHRCEDAMRQIGENPLEAAEVKANIAAAEAQNQNALLAAQQLPKEQADLVRVEADEKEAAKLQENLQKANQSADNEWKAALAIEQERSALLPEEYRAAGSLQREQEFVQKKQQEIKRAFDAAQENLQRVKKEQAISNAQMQSAKENQQKTKARYEATAAVFAGRLAAAQFAGIEAYNAAKRKLEYRKTLAERIQEFEKRLIAAKKAMENANQEVAGLVMPDLAKLEAVAQEVEQAYRSVFALWCSQQDAAKKQLKQQKSLQELAKQLAKLNEDYGTIGTLAEVANGKNVHGITFQRFVMKSLLEDVIDASNMRLKVMSRGQYMLQSTDERARKNAAGGLEMEVFDHYTGYARPVSTLSGGETFLASLALALGLADVVQSYSGGIHLDTILVDEGFGTLDPESLDIAIKALIDLQKGGRLVGIISHVPELKERIDARLEVMKGKGGSTAHFCVG